MKKILFLLLFFVALLTMRPPVSYAQNTQSSKTAQSRWVVDKDVTFVGKNAARAGLLFDWSLQHYNWICVKQTADYTCENRNHPLTWYWSLYFGVPMTLLVFVFMFVKKEKTIPQNRLLTMFAITFLLVALSSPVLQFIYQFTDGMQGFLLRTYEGACPPHCISQDYFLNVGWNYKEFVGIRRIGDNPILVDSTFTALLLSKLTALIYYMITYVLILRKILLWAFLFIVPIMPLLFLYKPLRNIIKIALGEMTFWVLYGPLLMASLQGLAMFWQSGFFSIFKNADVGDPTKIIFPTAINILLGGPSQHVTQTNNVNIPLTFVEYVLSLLMLIAAIILPWILLRIAIDYTLSHFTTKENATNSSKKEEKEPLKEKPLSQPKEDTKQTDEPLQQEE